jgi:zona occludens toxin
VFHVLPAILSGRKVITNLPLMLDAFKNLGADVELIEFRTTSMENPKPFSRLDDYGSEWRGHGGIGPLYVIDECHKPLPKGMTGRIVEEWYAEHRHEGADCLLITQSYGKISQSIRDMVQVVYRVRKATALGSDKRYIRKVQDGLRGEVMNENIRMYNPDRFALYQSHTKTNSAVSEAGASDVKPIWKHWSVIGGAVMVPIGVLMIALTAGDVFFRDTPAPEPAPVAVVEPTGYVPHNLRDSSAPSTVSAPEPKPEPKNQDHPFSKLGLHISAYLHSAVKDKTMYNIYASQNGQRVFSMSDSELSKAGYEMEFITPCLIKISFEKYTDYLTCDLPRQSTNL